MVAPDGGMVGGTEKRHEGTLGDTNVWVMVIKVCKTSRTLWTEYLIWMHFIAGKL